jgi:hypothetical protein
MSPRGVFLGTGERIRKVLKDEVGRDMPEQRQGWKLEGECLAVGRQEKEMDG